MRSFEQKLVDDYEAKIDLERKQKEYSLSKVKEGLRNIIDESNRIAGHLNILGIKNDINNFGDKPT